MIRRAAKVAGFAVLITVIALLLVNAFPSAVGADRTYTVQSGSMEPAIPTGSVVFVKSVPAEDIQEGDVITYSDSPSSPTTTHRVVRKFEGENSIRFRTKGDANEDVDPEPVYRNEIVGVVIFSVPYVGYLVSFAGTRMGWVVFIAVPCSLLILSELWELYKAMEPAE